ncbi:MAG: hypothetical protein ACFE0O_03395 [Opitutales bacterium]
MHLRISREAGTRGSLRFSPLFLLLTSLLFAGLVHADQESGYDPQIWRDRTGAAIQAELTAAWGPYAFFAFADGRSMFFPIAHLDRRSRKQIQARLAELAEDRASGPGAFASFIRDHRVRLADDGYLRPDPGHASEEPPEFYLLVLGQADHPVGRQLMERLARLDAEWAGRGWSSCEIVWVSRDRWNRAMQRVFREIEPGFGALRFGHRFDDRLRILDYGVYPVLALVDRYGNLLLHSVRGREIEPPGKLLQRLDYMLPYAEETGVARLRQ